MTKIELFLTDKGSELKAYLYSSKSINAICRDAKVTHNAKNSNIIVNIAHKYGIDIKNAPNSKHRIDYSTLRCINCGKQLTHGQRKFCSCSCSASYNNGLRPKKTIYCLNCGIKLNEHQNKFCCQSCNLEYNEARRIEAWLNGTDIPVSIYVPTFIKRYLFKKYNSKCERCGWSEIHPITGNVPLQIHHINGNCTDNKLENLQLLCPNCHSLTETYGNLNKGNNTRYT